MAHGYSPPDRLHSNSPPGYFPADSPISPWSSSSLFSVDPDSLTLPPLRRFDDQSFVFQPLRTALPHSRLQARHSPPPPQINSSATAQYQPYTGIYDIPDLPGISDQQEHFLSFEAHSPPSPTTRASSVVDLTSSSTADMPSVRNKRKASYTEEERAESKRQRGDTPNGQGSNKSTHSPKPDIEEVDFTEVDDDQKYEDYKRKQQEDLLKQQNQSRADTPIKLAAFQCIICLDNPTDLTVTHCGHLFCSLCLHEALHTGTHKKNCPVCRQVISTTKKPARNGDITPKPPKNGVYALEMKLMTARRKGKLPAICK